MAVAAARGDSIGRSGQTAGSGSSVKYAEHPGASYGQTLAGRLAINGVIRLIGSVRAHGLWRCSAFSKTPGHGLRVKYKARKRERAV